MFKMNDDISRIERDGTGIGIAGTILLAMLLFPSQLLADGPSDVLVSNSDWALTISIHSQDGLVVGAKELDDEAGYGCIALYQVGFPDGSDEPPAAVWPAKGEGKGDADESDVECESTYNQLIQSTGSGFINGELVDDPPAWGLAEAAVENGEIHFIIYRAKEEGMQEIALEIIDAPQESRHIKLDD